jgi:translation initiation factor 5
MPKLIAKIEGRGNGIKTVISNMEQIAKALDRPPSYSCKYFGIELGAQATSDEKTSRYVITGAHDQDKLQNTLDGFIDKFVLCTSCKNPETELHFSKDAFINKNCKACGHKGPVDMRHKLVTYILKTAQDASKKDKKKDRKNREKGDGTETPDGSDGEVDDLTKQIQADAAMISIDNSEATEDFLDESTPEAVAKRHQELEMSSAVAKLLLDGIIILMKKSMRILQIHLMSLQKKFRRKVQALHLLKLLNLQRILV